MTCAPDRYWAWARRALIGALAMTLSVASAVAQESRTPHAAPGNAWKSSPFHGVPNAATGQNIPCVCRFKDHDYRVGQRVCMNTYKGVMVAVCDLNLNNTTWEPTGEPCDVS